jgi:hypothetical protein
MLRLAEYQESLAAYVLAAAGDAAPAALCAALHDGAAAEARLGIYKNNVFARLIEALEAVYPAVARLVGKGFFRFAAQSYIPEHPPRSAALLDYGASFAAFLESFAPAASVPYLADVARLEWLYLRAHHAADVSPLDGGHRHDAPFAESCGLRLSLHPSAGLMTSPYPVSRIWELNRRAGDVEETLLPAEAEHLLVIRPHAQVEVRRLSAGAYVTLSAIGAGKRLGEALAAGRAADDEFEPERHFAALLRRGTFVALQDRHGAQEARDE